MRAGLHGASVAGAVLLAAVLAAGCRPEPRPSNVRGVLRVYATESLAPVARRHAEMFNQRFTDARVEVVTRTTRGALVALLADSTRLVYVDRTFNAEEQAAASARPDTSQIGAVKIGSGALALVVHPSNAVTEVPVGALPTLVRDSLATWAAVGGGAGRVELATTGRNSGAFELLTERFVRGPGAVRPRFVGATAAEVLAFVARRPNALGVVPLEALGDAAAVRTLALRGRAGAVRPSPLAVYRGTYPLRYDAYVLRVSGPFGPVQVRLASFAAEQLGQRAVQRAGFVPVTVPARQLTIADDPAADELQLD